MKNSWLLLPTFVLLLMCNSAFAQLPPKVLIPATPTYEFFDTSCYIPSGTLVLPQGKVHNVHGGDLGPIFIPNNKYTWALSIAHAWNYTRNALKMPNKFSMDIWLAVSYDESDLACIPGMLWTPADRTSLHQVNWASRYNGDGCFQFENSGAWVSGAGELQQAYPTRFVAADPRFYFNYSYERGALGLAYEFVIEMSWSRYKFGVDPYAIAVNAADPLALHKVFGAFHNNQTASFSAIPNYLYTNRVALQTNACWPDFGALGNPTYVTKQGKILSVLQGLTTHGNYPGGSSQKFADFNANIPWDTVQTYLNTIFPFYHEYSAAQRTALTNKVRAKFIQVSGAITTPIPFRNLGPVMDVIILGLPKEDPTIPSLYYWPPNWDGQLVGWGPIVPTGKIGYDSKVACLGTSYDLSALVTGGDGPGITFKWYRNGSSTPFATTRNIIESPSVAGTYTYKLELCNASGQCLPALCEISIQVNNCGGCGMTVVPATVNTPCQNMKAGTINLNVTGSSHYTVNFTGPVSGSIVSTTAASSITNVPNGLYNIEIIDFTTPTCKAYTNATVLFTTAQNAQLDALITSATPCLANVQAKVVENPAPCLWTVNFYEPTYFGWSPAVYAVISPGTNSPGMYQANIQNPLVGWQEVRGQVQFYASTGDQIKIDLTVVPTPGASNLRPIYFEIVNSSNVVVWSGTAPAEMVKAPGTVNASLITYTVGCPFTPPSYTFSWNPTLATVSNTSNTSTGTVDINFTTPTLYTVTAQNAVNTQCSLTDTIWIQPTCPTALPVQFVSFDALLINQHQVQLNWATATEKNAYYFQVERSLDGIHFVPVSHSIAAAGNSSSLTSYHYLDNYTPRGTVYYRIAEYDVDGTKMYSQIKNVEGLMKMKATVYPNPSANSFNVLVEGEDNEKIILVLYDVLGHVVERKTVSSNSTTAIGEHLTQGAYILHVQKPDETITVQKLIKE